MMATGLDFVKIARRHVGERYVLGATVPKDHPTYTGPWDCAEFVSWVTYQVTGRLYGCIDDDCDPAVADAYTGAWARDARSRGVVVPVDVAAATPGAIVLRAPVTGMNKMGHIVFSDGKGGTIEAHSTKRGLICSTLNGRRWDCGLELESVDYTTGNGIAVAPSTTAVYRLTDPSMRGSAVRRIQKALRNFGFSPGRVDGIYGPHTAAAVASFQAGKGLVVDGEVGARTAKALGITID